MRVEAPSLCLALKSVSCHSWRHGQLPRMNNLKAPYEYNPSPPAPSHSITSPISCFHWFQVQIPYTGQADRGALLYSSCTTHQNNMCQRHVFLATVANKNGVITLQLPTVDDRVAPQRVVMLFLLNGEVG